MKILVTYIKQNNRPRILGLYTEAYSMERNNDFSPIFKSESLLDVENFLNLNPYSFCSYFYTDISSDLDEENFVNIFGNKILLSIENFGDENVLPALSMGKVD